MVISLHKDIENKWRKKWDESKIFESNPDDREKLFLTVAYPYPSGAMHIGHGRTYTVPDVYARFMRMMGNDVLYIVGTDEHGTTSEVGALKEGMDVQSYCDMNHERHYKTYKDFNLSFDYFGRTSSEQNK